MRIVTEISELPVEIRDKITLDKETEQPISDIIDTSEQDMLDLTAIITTQQEYDLENIALALKKEAEILLKIINYITHTHQHYK